MGERYPEKSSLRDVRDGPVAVAASQKSRDGSGGKNDGLCKVQEWRARLEGEMDEPEDGHDMRGATTLLLAKREFVQQHLGKQAANSVNFPTQKQA